MDCIYLGGTLHHSHGKLIDYLNHSIKFCYYQEDMVHIGVVFIHLNKEKIFFFKEFPHSSEEMKSLE